MTWLASVLVAVLTGIIGMFLSGFIANLAVGWYRISSFEGGSGYFVVGLAIMGLIGGSIVGLVAARLIAAGTDPGFLKALAASVTTVLVLGAGIGGVARLLADVPPEIDGESLFLAIELRWPATTAPDPASLAGLGFTRLGTGTSSRNIRKQESGPLFVEDARKVEGRWVVPGVVRIFTARGERILTVGIGETTLGGFLLPLPGKPGQADREWSEWMPRARPGRPPIPDSAYTVRFRVLRHSEPIRLDQIGPFEVATITNGFFGVAGSDQLASYSRFSVSHRGNPIPGLGDAGAVAVVAGSTPTLLVQVTDSLDNDLCQTVTEVGEQVGVAPIGPCHGSIVGTLLTADSAAYRRATAPVVVPGWIDRVRFATPGLYLIASTVFDSRSLTAAPTTYPSDPSPINGLPPIGLSPDERSFVWFTHDGSEDRPVLGVTDWKANRSYAVPIDRDRMRYSDYRLLDPGWVAHHFAWVPDAEGVDRLTERKDFKPLPHRGELTVGPGQYQSYTLQPGGDPLRKAMIDVLVRDLSVERLPDELDGYHIVIKIAGETFNAAVIESPGYVSISTYKGTPEVMARIAATLDAAVATGRYDALFRKDP